MVIWRTIMSLAIWILWKARCDYVFNNVHIHLNTMLIEFWMLFVHRLHGQYDDLQGSDDVLWQRHCLFHIWHHLFDETLILAFVSYNRSDMKYLLLFSLFIVFKKYTEVHLSLKLKRKRVCELSSSWPYMFMSVLWLHVILYDSI